MNHQEVQYWLQEQNEENLQTLWQRADRVRSERVGDGVYLRGLVEISNYCVRRCAYCGLQAGNRRLQRYRLNEEEILQCVSEIEQLGIGTVVMQGGEDEGLDSAWIARIIRQIKTTTSLAVTLSLGERPIDDLILWKEAGADRYLLRFETSDRKLYQSIHPAYKDRVQHRLELLPMIRTIGYEVGSGVMIGLPGQTYSSLANDLLLFRQLDLDMIGVGPYIPHHETPLGRIQTQHSSEQVSNTELMTYKVIALARLLCPEANIPATTALSTLNPESGHQVALQRGANIVMPNITPAQKRTYYEIYPGKAGVKISFYEQGALNQFYQKVRSIGRFIELA